MSEFSWTVQCRRCGRKLTAFTETAKRVAVCPACILVLKREGERKDQPFAILRRELTK